MADWLTHVLLTLALIEIIRLRYEWVTKYRVFALIGGFIPDLQTITMFLGALGEKLSPYLQAIHTPIGLIIIAGLLTYLFKPKERSEIFIALWFGGLFHLFIDLFIVSLGGKVMLLYPFSLQRFGFGLFRQGGFIFLYVAMILFVLSFLVSYMVRRAGINLR